MPEAPEVQTVLSTLETQIQNLKILKVDENGTAISGASMVLYKKSQLSLGSSD